MGKTHSPEQKSTTEQSSAEKGNEETRLSLMAKMLLLPIYFYRYFISPLIGPRCRFYPSCSTYAVEAIKIHGALKGGYLAIKRILRCNPLSEGGEDPVPCKQCKKNH
nr:membrane protein insertion efficiency factor YidD [uncultured Haemophilus sp.]